MNMDKQIYIEILGGPKCEKTAETMGNILELFKELGLDGEVKKITKAEKIAEYPLKYTPGVVFNGQLVYSPLGTKTSKFGVELEAPNKDKLKKLLKKYYNI